jgi:mannose-6-phosphate isomerase-like protein (cupin superfamily)
MTTTAGRVVHLDDVEPIRWAGEESGRWLLRGEDTGGRYSFYEVTVPAGQGALFHIHEDMDEAFFVTAGEFEIQIGEQAHRTTAGALVYGPRSVGHSFRNTWDKPSTMLCITTPGGIEDFFTELSDLLRADPPPEWERMRALAAKHRIIAFPPPDGTPPS